MKKENIKCLGIWLDHTKAHLIEYDNGETKTETLFSGYSKQIRTKGESPSGIKLGNHRSSDDEYSKHHRRMELLSHYYKVLGDRIKRYDEIILFGPSKAKVELFNFLLKDKKTGHVVVNKVEESRMTEKQMNAFVKNYFEATFIEI